MSRLSLKKVDISRTPFSRALLEASISIKELFVDGANIGKPGGLAYAPEASPELYPVMLTRCVSLVGYCIMEVQLFAEDHVIKP